MKASTKSIIWNSLAFFTQLYLLLVALSSLMAFFSIFSFSAPTIDAAMNNFGYFDRFLLPILILFPIFSVLGITYGVFAVSREGFQLRSILGFIIYFFLPTLVVLVPLLSKLVE